MKFFQKKRCMSGKERSNEVNEKSKIWEKEKEIGMQPENWCEGRER